MLNDPSLAGMVVQCPHCAQQLQMPGQPVAYIQPAPSQPTWRSHNPPKSPGVAAVLSFLWCGLGQIYNGDIGKGVMFLIFSLVAAALCFLLIGFFIVPVLWLWSIIDAYNAADSHNRRYSR